MANVRKAKVAASIDGKSVSSMLVDTFTYTDYADANADALTLVLDNHSGKYLKGSMPAKSDKVHAKIKTSDWDIFKSGSIDTGKMYVDTIEGSGGELEQVTVNALSKPSYSALSSTERTHTFKDKTVKYILKKIASRNKLTLKYYGPKLTLKKIKQDGQTDLDFVTTLCQKYGMKCKIFNKKLIVYSSVKYAKKKPVATIKRNAVGTNGYTYNNDIQGAYTYAKATYTKKVTKKKKTKSGKTKTTKAEEKKTVKIGKKKIKKTYSHYYVAILKDDRKVRKTRSAKGKVVATFKKGHKARIIKDYGNGWLKVAYEKTVTKKVKVGSTSAGAQKVIAKAKSQVGNHYSSKYNGAPRDKWCAGFVTWCLKQTGNLPAGFKGSNAVATWRSWASNHHRMTSKPKAGDLAFWKVSKSHIGIVIKVDTKKKKIYTIEGNTSGSGPGHRVVAKHTYSSKYRSSPDGYISMTYGGKSGKAKYKKKKIKVKHHGYIYIGKKKQKATIKRKTKVHKHNIARTLVVDDEGYNRADARRIAQAALNRENESIETLSMTIPGGNQKIVAGTNVKLGKDWGGLAGKWFVDQAEHSVSSSSFYTTALTTHRVTSANTKKLEKEYKKVGKKYKFTGGYVHTSSKGGKKTKIKAGKAVIKKVNKKGKYTYKVTITVTSGKGKKKKTKKYTGWVSESQLKRIKAKNKSSSKSKSNSKTKKSGKGRYVSKNSSRWWKKGQKWKVTATYDAGFSMFWGPQGSSTGLGNYEGLTCASSPKLARKFIRISGTGTKWDGKILRVTDTGASRVRTIHRNDKYAGNKPVVWVDLYTPKSRSGFANEGLLYKKGGHTKKGHPSPKIQVLKKV